MDVEKFAIAMPAMAMIVNYMALTDATAALALWEHAEQIAMGAGASYISVEHVEQEAKRVYDKGYGAGAHDRERGTSTANPYRKTIGRGVYSRWEMWNVGYRDGSSGHQRRVSQSEADRQMRAELEQLRALVRKVAAMDGVICTCGAEHTDCVVAQARVLLAQ